MDIHSIATVAFENWFWANSTGEDDPYPHNRGIGGSETQQTEVAWRLAQRGHHVTVYAPVPWEGVREWRGTKWTHTKNADYSQPGLWMVYRNPELFDHFSMGHSGQCLLLCSQDEFYPSWNPERAAKCDIFQAICQTHAVYTAARCPGLKGKIVVVPNGLKLELIREVEKDPPERNPRRFMYASSPDRGLEPLLEIWPRIREWVHDAELHIFYGLDNIEKLCANPAFAHYKKFRDKILKLANQPGVTWHGRISQVELYREWQKTGIFCHPSMFTETGFITCCEAQALGAVPITNPIWAAGEYVRHGIFIDGNPYKDPLVQSRYVAEAVRLASDPRLQEAIRREMTMDARLTFNWERVVDELEAHLLGFSSHPLHHTQFAFQLKHAKGKILNAGCAGDPADFKALGAVNMDVSKEDPIFHRPTKADVLGDVRKMDEILPQKGHQKFNTIVLGDILEHFQLEAVPDILRRAARLLFADGRIVITVPDDTRPVDQQHAGSDGSELYTDGVSAVHTHRVTRADIDTWMDEACLVIEFIQPIEYGHFTGHGIVCRPMTTSESLDRIDKILADGDEVKPIPPAVTPEDFIEWQREVIEKQIKPIRVPNRGQED